MKKTKLFCFPYAGGSARVYKTWQKYLPEEIEIVPIEVKGRGKRYGEPFSPNMKEMVDDLFVQIENQLDEGDYAFFGHSMGAVIAYELCWRIIDNDLPRPLHLFLSGRQAPHIPDEDEDKTYLLPEKEFKEKLQEYGGTPAEVLENEELMNIFVPILRADFKVCETYEPTQRETPFNFGITLFTGSEEDLTEEQITGWQEYSQKELKTHKFPGGHFFIHDYTFNILRIVCKTMFDL